MIPDVSFLIVRAAIVYVTVLATVIVWAWRRPGRQAMAGAMLAFAWNLPGLLLLHVIAERVGWWRIDATGGLLLGMPVDVYLSWAWLWGVIPVLWSANVPLSVLLIAAFAIDIALMPAAAPVVQLGPNWIAGELVALIAVLLPGQQLARWTIRGEHLPWRAAFQILTFGGLTIVVLPAIAIEGSGSSWINPLDGPVWYIGILVQLLAGIGLVGLTAVQEFVTRGGGTPVPFDPPRRLVTTGVYAYVRNPMQLSAVLMLLVLGIALANPWVAAAGVMAHVYSIGLAGWDEDEDLRQRFGKRWLAYRGGVRAWVPRWRPWHDPDVPHSRLFVSETCGMCHEVGMWFHQHGARHLDIVAAESHSSVGLTRITYEPGDGSGPASGVEAIGRALEHIHLGWAFVGWMLRIPGVRWIAQLLTDASGGGQRQLARTAALSAPDAADHDTLVTRSLKNTIGRGV